MRQTNQCTPTFSLEYQTVCNDASTTNNTQVTNTKVNLTLKNTSSVDGSVTVQYRYLVTDTWSTLNNYSLNSNQTQTVPYILSNPYVEFQFAPTGTQNWSNTGSILKRTDCDTITTSVNNLTGVNSFICSEDQVFSTITIKNPTSDAVMVDYSYSVNNGNNWSTNKQIIIGSNDDITSEPVRIAKGNQIQWRYKPSSLSDDNYNTKIETAPINCDVVTAQQLIHTLGTCEDNKGISTIKITNLSGTTKSYLLEFKLNGGGYSSYGTVIVESGKDLSKAVRISDGQSIQWRIIDATSNASTIALDTNWTVSNSLTLDCTTITTTTTTTTIPPVKYIFEPIISTNRVCDFDDGGAEFGITVDNSRSNVSASVLKKIWINKTLIAEEIITVPAGQTIDFSSIEVGENKFFTVALEVTNTENGKVQKMIKNKDSDCIEDEIEINEEQNPIDEVEETEDIDNVMEGDGDDKELEDNGESLLFLPGDDFVEFVYNEDASNPFTPQFTDESPPTPGIPFTGRNVGGFIISFGLLLMGLGALILRRAY